LPSPSSLCVTYSEPSEEASLPTRNVLHARTRVGVEDARRRRRRRRERTLRGGGWETREGAEDTRFATHRVMASGASASDG
jgi:hypothetical protein